MSLYVCSSIQHCCCYEVTEFLLCNFLFEEESEIFGFVENSQFLLHTDFIHFAIFLNMNKISCGLYLFAGFCDFVHLSLRDFLFIYLFILCCICVFCVNVKEKCKYYLFKDCAFVNKDRYGMKEKFPVFTLGFYEKFNLMTFSSFCYLSRYLLCLIYLLLMYILSTTVIIINLCANDRHKIG